MWKTSNQLSILYVYQPALCYIRRNIWFKQKSLFAPHNLPRRNNWDIKRSSEIFLPMETKPEAFSRDLLTNVNVAAHRWTHTHLWSNDSSVLPVNGTSMSLICSDGSFLLTEKPNKPQKCFVPWHPFFYSFKSALQNKLTVTPDGRLMDWASI